MAKKNSSGSGNKIVSNSFIKFLTYVVFLLTALLSLFLICNVVLGWIDISLPSVLINIVSQVQKIAITVAICLGAWEYVSTKGKTKRNLFWAAVVIIVVALVFGISFPV